MYSINDQKSFDDLSLWIKEIRNNSEEKIPTKEEYVFFEQVKLFPDYKAYVFEGYAVKKFNFSG